MGWDSGWRARLALQRRKRWVLTGVQCLVDGGQHAGSGFFEAGLQDAAGGQSVASAAKPLGHAGHIDPGPGAEAYFHAAARLLHQQQAGLYDEPAPGVVHEVLTVLGDSTGCRVIVAPNLGPRDLAVGSDLQSRHHQARELELAKRILLVQLVVQLGGAGPMPYQ